MRLCPTSPTAALFLLVVPTGCGSATDDSGAPTDTSDCEILEDVSCLADTGHGELACPEGYTCSGPSAYWCYRGSCRDLPECLPPEAAIATPTGAVPLRDLVVGTPVFSLDAEGGLLVVPVERISHRQVPSTHRLVTLVLSDGRVVRGSPAHPGTDRRRLGDLQPGMALDGASVEVAERHAFAGPATWDLLPAGPTGHYQADGVWLGSTLVPERSPIAGR